MVFAEMYKREYVFQRADGSGVAFDIRPSWDEQEQMQVDLLVNLIAFDKGGLRKEFDWLDWSYAYHKYLELVLAQSGLFEKME